MYDWLIVLMLAIWKCSDFLFSVTTAVMLMCLWASDTLSPQAEFTIYSMSHFDRPESFSHILDLVWHKWATEKQQMNIKNTTKSFISNVSLHSTPARELQVICIYITDDYELMDVVFRSLIEVNVAIQ